MRLTVLCTDLGIRLPGDKGASLHLSAITTAFGELGHEVQLIAVGGHDELPSRLRQAVAEPLLLPHPGRSEGLERERRKLALADTVATDMREHVRRFRPHAIYERLSLFGDAGVRLADVTGAAHIVEVNALLSREDAKWRGLHLDTVARRREARVLQGCNVVVAVSDEVAGQIDAAYTSRRLEVVPNGVDVQRFAVMPQRTAARNRFDLDQAAPVAVFVGALRPWHGVDIAIRALARCQPNTVLVIAGDGPVAAELGDLARRVGVANRVRFLGQVDHGDIPAILVAADVALAPYPHLEEFSFSPLKVYEYLASGTPVIASEIGQIPELLGDGRYGTLVPAGDIASLAAAIDRVCGLPGALRMATAARSHTMSHHGWPQRASDICTMIEQEVAAHAVAN